MRDAPAEISCWIAQRSRGTPAIRFADREISPAGFERRVARRTGAPELRIISFGDAEAAGGLPALLEGASERRCDPDRLSAGRPPAAQTSPVVSAGRPEGTLHANEISRVGSARVLTTML